jgi:hypothetical protein
LVAQGHASLFLVEWASPSERSGAGVRLVGAHYFCRKRYAHGGMTALTGADRYLSGFFDPHDAAA